jgi:prepilin-type N-terminal cleavage/methylation domain-containing protein/prepilin-type processing-associated H-X9-DG protein
MTKNTLPGNRQYNPKIQAFTLIEILIVIAIIALLAAILFPVFSKARENARRTSCASNMKQLALAVRQYVDDNDGRSLVAHAATNSAGGSGYGHARDVWPQIEPYIKNEQLVFCPSAAKFRLTGGLTGQIYWGYQYGFPVNDDCKSTFIAVSTSVNQTGIAACTDYPLPLMEGFPEPARTCLLGETMYYTSDNVQYQTYGLGAQVFSAWDGSLIETNNKLNRGRHFEGSNYAFLDGHVKWIKQTQVDAVFVKQKALSGVMTVATASNYPIVFSWKP